MNIIGIDCGSTACKGVLLQDGNLIGKKIGPTGWSPLESAKNIYRQLTDYCPNEKEFKVVATGYGRAAIDFAHCSFTEITCHAQGAALLLPGVRLVIDIGGQDSKAIALQDGQVTAFQMNDKCAAGTGRFLEMTTARLGIAMDKLDDFLQKGESCSINSMCAVFAESEIISLLAQGQSREAVAGGVLESIGKKAYALISKIPIQEPILLTGGLSNIQYVKQMLAKELNHPVHTDALSPFAGAIGAALLGEKKYAQLKKLLD